MQCLFVSGCRCRIVASGAKRIACGVALLAAIGPLSGRAAIPPGATVVGTASASCPSPSFPTIGAAVAAAPAGSTIFVCAGLYPESVAIDRNLTLLGAQNGVSATTGRTNTAAETIVQAPSGHDFSYVGSATTGTIDGFTLLGNGAAAGNNDGIVGIENAGEGYRWVNNIITGTTTGINFHATGAVPTLISGNRIVDNKAPGGTQGSNGIFFTNGPANNATISNNVFGSQATDINTTGAGIAGVLSTGLAITGNASVDSGNFTVLFLTDGAVVSGNTISWTNINDTAAGSAIAILGGNTGTRIVNNNVSGGAANGIRVNDQFYTSTPNTAITISGNTVANRLNGIVVQTTAGLTSSSSISDNIVTDAGVGDAATAISGHGIWLQTGLGVNVANNRASGSVQLDCRDDTTGNATAGTANVWTDDNGATSSPADLCTPFIPPVTSVGIEQTVTPTHVVPNGTLTFTVVVTNAGTAAAGGTVVTDPLPAGIASFAWTCTASGGAACPNLNGTGALNETLATFPAGGQVTYSITATATSAPGTVTNVASAQPPAGGVCSPGNTTPPCTKSIVTPPAPPAAAIIGIAKTASTSTIGANEVFDFTITVTNAGTLAADGSIVADPLPAGIASYAWICTASGGAACPNATGGGAINEAIATFPGGSAVVYTVRATVSSAPPAQIVNIATVTRGGGTVCAPGGTPPPCAGNAVVATTPAAEAQPIPALSWVGLVALTLLLAMSMSTALRR